MLYEEFNKRTGQSRYFSDNEIHQRLFMLGLPIEEALPQLRSGVEIETPYAYIRKDKRTNG